MYISSCSIRSWNWNRKLTQDHFLIEHWIQRTHRCPAARCWPWVYSLGMVSRYSTVRSGTLTWREWGLWLTQHPQIRTSDGGPGRDTRAMTFARGSWGQNLDWPGYGYKFTHNLVAHLGPICSWEYINCAYDSLYDFIWDYSLTPHQKHPAAISIITPPPGSLNTSH